MLDHYIHIHVETPYQGIIIHVSAYNMQLAYVHVYVYTYMRDHVYLYKAMELIRLASQRQYG